MTLSRSRTAYVLLFALLLYSMQVFEIDPRMLLQGASGGAGSTDDLLDAYSSSSRLNQLFVPAMFVASGLLFVLSEHPRRLLARCPGVTLFLLATALLMLASVAVSEHTAITIKRAASHWMFMASAMLLVLSTAEERQLHLTVGLAFAVALSIDVFLAVTSFQGFSDELGFVGYLGNKNLTGNQYGIATMVFLYLALSRRSVLFGLLMLPSAALLLVSESKTSMGTVAIFLVLLVGYRWVQARRLIVFATLFACVGYSLYLSLGGNDPDMITQRGEIWNFLSQFVWERPLLGYGFSSFWAVGDQSFNLTMGSGFLQRINTGHNGYIDLILGTGIVGLTVVGLFAVAAAALLANLGPRHFLVHYIFIAFLIANVTESFLMYYQNIMWLLVIVFVTATYVETNTSPVRRRRVLARTADEYRTPSRSSRSARPSRARRAAR